MSAAALAGELGLPLFTILLHGLITKFLGETAAKLHLVFNAMKNARGVYFFDEFDAIGGHRETHNDIAEIRRTLNSFLQFIEQDQSESLIVAATNNKGLLDRALFRRFDDVIEYELPTPELASELIRSRLAIFRLAGISWDKVKQASQGLSQADVVAACDDVAKALVMSGTSLVKTKQLVTAMGERANM